MQGVYHEYIDGVTALCIHILCNHCTVMFVIEREVFNNLIFAYSVANLLNLVTTQPEMSKDAYKQ